MSDQIVEPVAPAAPDASAQPAAPATPPVAPAAGDPPAPPVGNIVDGDGAPPDLRAPADWPDDWREKMAGGDEKLLGRLKRFTQPGNVLKSWLAAETKLSSGDLKRALPDNASAEELSTWRKENGIPDAPDGYKIELPNGIVIGEADKPLVEAFTAHVHAKNWSPAQVNQAMEWYFQQQDTVRAETERADQAFHAESIRVLGQDWGNEFTPNVNAIKNLTSNWSPEARDRLLGGRTSDGRLIGNDPAILKELAQMARDMNPGATLVPAGTSDIAKGLNDRLAELTKMSGDYNSDYWKGAKASDLQQEYRDLLEARQKMQARAA